MILEIKKILCLIVWLDVCLVFVIGNCFLCGFVSKIRYDWGGNNVKDNFLFMVLIRERRMCLCMVLYNYRFSFF